jgi:flagellin-specific chaperone FliS
MTTANAPLNTRALGAYAAARDLNQNPRDVLAAVHEELYRAIASAKSAHEAGALDQMCRHAARATQILMVLSTSLDFSAAGADGAMLRRFYRSLLEMLTEASRRSIMSPSYQKSLDLLRPFCKCLRGNE